MQPDTAERIRAIVSAELGLQTAALSDHTRAQDIPGWDSVVMVDILFALEAAFGIEFSGDDMASVQTVGDLHRIVQLHLE